MMRKMICTALMMLIAIAFSAPVFAFIFGAPNTLGLPKANITGVARRSYAADIWKMAKDFTGAKTVALISKNTFSMTGVKQVLTAQADGLEKLSGVKYMDMFLCDTFEQWEGHIKNWPAEMIYLADASRINKAGKEMTNQELVTWTVANATVPVIASNEEDTRNGALFSIVADIKGWGGASFSNGPEDSCRNAGLTDSHGNRNQGFSFDECKNRRQDGR